MGLGAMFVRGALVSAAGSILYVAVLNPIINKLNGDDPVIEPGYVSPKSLSIQGRKNIGGNIETYLNYKNGDETVSLPCKKGSEGPLCGSVEYWWQSIGAQVREGLAVAEWPVISNSNKHSIMSSELRVILDTFYAVQKAQQAQQSR